MKELLLSSGQVEWKAAGFQPGLPTWILKDKRKDFSTADSDSPVTEWFDITVPGGIQYDLFRHSLIPNPYQDMNSLYCEWVEHRWWVCQTCFDKNVILASWEGNNPPSRVELFLEGLDYEADIYLEGILLGAHRGMFHPAVFDITDLFERSTAENGKMHLIIVLKGAPEEQGQYGWTSRTTTQKSRFNYKWDFSTRLVNIGIWKDVKIRLYDEWSLEYPGVWSDHDGNTGKLVMETGVIAHHSDPVIASQPCTLRVECLDPDRKDSRIFREEVVSAAAGERIRMEIHYPDAQPWWPNGHGAQPLVDVRLILICQGRRLDEWTCKTGFRRLEYRHNEGSPSGALPYTYAVNGKRIYAKGVNLVPLDHLYGNLRPEQYEYLVLCMRHANVNLVRVWGGGLVEQDLFYQLCDRYGILVWQEFIQSSSGIENVPAKGKDFLDLLAESARYAVQTLRSHVSLSMWGGGNELMDADRNPANYGDENISMLRDIVKKYDPQRYFLPTSSSGPFFSVFADKPGISHDVHGAWSYRGNPAHYAVYNQSDCLFHGEFGTNGAS
ncbi:MAG TPA: hypothetical protein DD727_01145, partial [Clostridiales bacterium]|nr:hypothetical protein [Clostridiales bacterium]